MLARRAEALRRVIYKAQRAVDRGNRLLAQLAPAQKAPGQPGDPMENIRRWKAAGMPDDWPVFDRRGRGASSALER